MEIPRRQFLHLARGAAALPVVSCLDWAQAYPTGPITMMVPYPPGGDGRDFAQRCRAHEGGARATHERQQGNDAHR